MTDDHVVSLRDALLAVVRDGADLPDVLSGALGRAAIELGSVDALVGQRPDSQDAELTRMLADWAFPTDGATGESRPYHQLTEQEGGPPNERWPDTTCRPDLRGGIG